MNTTTRYINIILSKLTLGPAHWFLRLPIAAIAFSYGMQKFADLSAAEVYGLPVWLYFMSGVGELGGAIGLIVGGAIGQRFTPFINALGDLLTRLSGIGIASVTAGVIVMIYWGPWVGWQFQSLILAAALFFALRGNDTWAQPKSNDEDVMLHVQPAE